MKWTKIAIAGHDNDFCTQQKAALQSLLYTYEYVSWLDESKEAITRFLFSALDNICLFQEKPQGYPWKEETKILFDDEVDKHIDYQGGWCNSETTVLDFNIYMHNKDQCIYWI